jgi:hypothetical protein
MINNNTKKRLNEIEARCEKATKGPWRIKSCPCPNPQCQYQWPGPAAGIQGSGYLPNDAEFISHSREDIPWLIEQVKKLIAWKESELAIESDWNPQEVGRLLGLKPSQSIRRHIQPGIKALLDEQGLLKRDVLILEAKLTTAIRALKKIENQDDMDSSSVYAIAYDALEDLKLLSSRHRPTTL